MEGYEAILARRSIRKFTGQEISDEVMNKLLTAAMSGPSCANTKDSAFIVIRNKQTMETIAKCNGRPAALLPNAAAAILVCGDKDRAFPRAKDYWVIDASIAAQNIMLAATAMGIGSVILGTWPQMDRVEGLRNAFSLPENVVPLAVIALGYPDEAPEAKSLYESDRVHYENW